MSWRGVEVIGWWEGPLVQEGPGRHGLAGHMQGAAEEGAGGK